MPDLKQDARTAAAASPSQWFVAVYPKGGKPTYEDIGTRAELDAVYGHLADDNGSYDYVAAFDKSEAAWPGPVFEFGQGTITVRAPQAPAAQPSAPAKDSGGAVLLVLLAIVFLVGSDKR